MTRNGWPVSLVSAAVTVHFLAGAVVVANLPALYRRFGLASITKAGAIASGLGVCGWAWAQVPWQLFAATLLSGAGWVAMSAAAINAIVAPWFDRQRPIALSTAYNGASIGGVVFSPLWVAAIASLGFGLAAILIAVVTTVVVWWLADRLFSKTPAAMGLHPDGIGSSEIVMALKSGRAIRFNESTVRPMGRTATGVRGISLEDKNDEVVGMISIDNPETTVLVVSEKGYGKRTDIDDYRVTNRGGKGVKTLNITDKTGKLVAIKGVTDKEDLMIINKSGIIIRIAISELRTMGRATQGVRLITLKGDDEIASVAKIEHDEDEETQDNIEGTDNSEGTENPDTEPSTGEETE